MLTVITVNNDCFLVMDDFQAESARYYQCVRSVLRSTRLFTQGVFLSYDVCIISIESNQNMTRYMQITLR